MRAATIAVMLLGAWLFVDAATADTDVTPHGNAFLAGTDATHSDSRSDGTGTVDSTVGDYSEFPVCAVKVGRACGDVMHCGPGNQGTEMAYSATDATGDFATGEYCSLHNLGQQVPATITPATVLRAFRRIPVPAQRLHIQPPHGRTLVNFETNFYTTDRTLNRTVRLLGQRVQLRIYVADHDFRFGDGHTKQTASAGAPYPDLEVTHSYLRKGSYRPRVATTWAADFRVGGAPWRTVDGTVPVTGPAQRLEVVEATSVLVAPGG